MNLGRINGYTLGDFIITIFDARDGISDILLSIANHCSCFLLSFT